MCGYSFTFSEGGFGVTLPNNQLDCWTSTRAQGCYTAQALGTEDHQPHSLRNLQAIPRNAGEAVWCLEQTLVGQMDGM